MTTRTLSLTTALTTTAMVLAATAAADATLAIGGTGTAPLLRDVLTPIEKALGVVRPPPFAPPGAQFVQYPASLWPVTGLDAPFLGSSVSAGDAATLAALTQIGGGTVTVESLSQGALVGHDVQNDLAAHPDAAPAGTTLTFVYFGDPINAANGILRVLPINVEGYQDPGIATSQYPTIEVTNQYDPFADFPDRPLDLVADANVILGFIEGQHGHNTNLSTLPPTTVVTQNGNVTTYFVPDPTLPLTEPLRHLGVPPPIVNALDEVLRPLVEAGYAPSVVRGTAAVPKTATGSTAAVVQTRTKPSPRTGRQRQNEREPHEVSPLRHRP